MHYKNCHLRLQVFGVDSIGTLGLSGAIQYHRHIHHILDNIGTVSIVILKTVKNGTLIKTMKTKEQTITDMCYTYRHDYGLHKEEGEPPWTSGMTEQDAKMLYKTMEQIYNNNIEPLIEHYKGKENATK